MLRRPDVALSTVLYAFPVGVLASVAVAIVAEAPLFADRLIGDTVMAPVLLGLPLWGCLYSLLGLMLPSVRCVVWIAAAVPIVVSAQARGVCLGIQRCWVVGSHSDDVAAGAACAFKVSRVAVGAEAIQVVHKSRGRGGCNLCCSRNSIITVS